MLCYRFFESLYKIRVVDDTTIVSFSLWTPDKNNYCKSVDTGHQNKYIAKANVCRQV